jgi:mitochondrial fission protein ELM1
MDGSEQRLEQPVVWALLGHRTGDNLQVEALVEALGWPCERKLLAWPKGGFGWSPRYGRMDPSLAPLTPESRLSLAPPWPDLVVAIGWRSVPVSRWIARESGCRLVQIGRPRAPLDSFDLIITTPQYGLPEAPNVLHLDGPVNLRTPGDLAAAAEVWRGQLDHLPRPWTAVLLGGDAPPLRFQPDSARRLGAQVNRMAAEAGGSVLAATSPRTPGDSFEAFLAEITVPAHHYLWGGPGENPYAGYLGLADAFVVTTDSISMAHEAAGTGKPLYLFALPPGGSHVLRAMQAADIALRSGPLARAYERLIAGGWTYSPRDPSKYFARLIERGCAAYLGDPPALAGPHDGAPAGLERAVRAVRELMGR